MQVLGPGTLVLDMERRNINWGKLWRFALVSGISTVVSFSAISLLYGLSIIPDAIWASLAGNAIAAVPAYFLNRTWTWKKRGRSSLTGEVLPFAVMSVAGALVALAGAAWIRGVVHSHHWSHSFNTLVVAGVNVGCFGVFWLAKLLVFNRIFRPGNANDDVKV